MKLTLLLLSVVLLGPSSSFGQSTSFLSLFEKAKQGDVDAQDEVGIAYSEGKGVRPNQKRAVYWFRKSAEQGYAIATCNLALHYGRGWGVPKNHTLMWKYIFAAHALDGLKCNPGEMLESPQFKNQPCSIERGWQFAVAWLRAHPDFKNNFGERPWMEAKGEYPRTIRTSGSSVKLPIPTTRKCGRSKSL